MTTNQERAIALAEGICAGTVDPLSVADEDWHLLLLAAGMNHCRSLPPTLCRRVLSRANQRVGYFQPAGDPIETEGPQRREAKAASASSAGSPRGDMLRFASRMR